MKRFIKRLDETIGRKLTPKEEVILRLGGVGNNEYHFDRNGRLIIMSDYRNNCNLEDLEDFPFEVYGDFKVNHSKLKSLKGGPVKVSLSFDCRMNDLTSLADGPLEVGKSYNCSSNHLQSLEGCPQHIKSSFSASHNPLKTLVGGPIKVDRHYDCQDCGLNTLVGVAKDIDYSFDCSNNNGLESFYGLGRVGSVIEFDDCPNIDQREIELYKYHRTIFDQWLQTGLEFKDFYGTKRYHDAIMDFKLDKDIEGLWT